MRLFAIRRASGYVNENLILDGLLPSNSYIAGMDFSTIDIYAFLRASLPHRFQDINPYDFEKFVAVLFREDGYEVEETDYSGDFGADLILEKDGEKTVVQVKRYAKGTQVSVGDVNQVIGAKQYYHAKNALVITTSGFSSPAIALAKSAQVVLWNWQKLEQYISTVYLDDLSHAEYFREELAVENEDSDLRDLFELQLLEINDIIDPKYDEMIEVRMGLNNTSGDNLTVHLDLPIIISKKTKRQVTAFQWKDNFFFHGVIVNGATVEIGFHYLRDQIPMIKPGDRLILNIHVAGMEHPFVIDQKLKDPSKNCFIVTYLFGRDSWQYHAMINVRDRFLRKFWFGRVFIGWYYQLSPWLVRWVGKRKGSDSV